MVISFWGRNRREMFRSWCRILRCSSGVKKSWLVQVSSRGRNGRERFRSWCRILRWSNGMKKSWL
jgi:hypothetical protein